MRLELDAQTSPDRRFRSAPAAILTLPAPVRRLRVLPFAHERAVVAVRVGVIDPRETEVPLALAARGRVLTQSRRLNPEFYDAVVAAFKEARVPSPLPEIEGASVGQLLLQVAAGAGMALVPESVADRIRVPGVGFRHLTPRSSVRCQLAAVTMNATRGEPVVNFLAALAKAPVTCEGFRAVELVMRPRSNAARPQARSLLPDGCAPTQPIDPGSRHESGFGRSDSYACRYSVKTAASRRSLVALSSRPSLSY